MSPLTRNAVKHMEYEGAAQQRNAEIDPAMATKLALENNVYCRNHQGPHGSGCNRVRAAIPAVATGETGQRHSAQMGLKA